MRSFSGSGGEINLVSVPASFNRLPLEDCGDGFDWRAADETMRHWVADVPAAFHTLQGEELVSVEPDWVFPASGRVGFSRCLRQSVVFASGVCLPTTRVCRGDRWELRVGMMTVDRSEMGDVDQRFASIPAPSTVSFSPVAGSRLPIASDRVLVVLPHSAGSFFSVGDVLSVVGGVVEINLDQNGVSYGPC